MMDRCCLVLLEISKRLESKGGHVQMCSCELGEILGVSQQSASRYLSELESKGFIERHRRHMISLTSEGIALLEDIFINLKSFFEGGSEPLRIEGRIAAGFGEGAYYVKEYSDRLEKHLGFKPFYGTLNIKPLHSFSCLERYASGVIKGFKSKGRSFGSLMYLPVRLSGGDWVQDSFLVLPKRTHHIDELEIVCSECLRKKYGLGDGDPVTLTVGSG